MQTERPRAEVHIPLRMVSLVIAAAALLYFGMAMLTGWDELESRVLTLPGLIWGEVLALSLLSYALRFVRWHFFLRALGTRVPIGRSLIIYLSGFALTLTPGKAGELVRSFYLRPCGVSYPKSIGAFVSERLLDIAAVGGLACFAIGLFPEQRLWIAGAMLLGVLLLVAFHSRLLLYASAYLAKSALGRHAAGLLMTIRVLLSGKRLLGALPLSVMAWMVQGVSLHWVLGALGYDWPLVNALAIYSLSILAGAASFIPGGLGATETAMVLLLQATGASYEDAMTASLLCRGMTLWPAVMLGLLSLCKMACLPAQEARPGSP